MSTNLVAKPRRFRVTLWKLDSDLNPVKELTEVLNFNATFTMGSIPMASVGPPHGVEVHTERYSEIINELDRMVKDKAPLGIAVERIPEVLHATTSDINDDDPDCKWPKEKVMVFKGYAAARAFNKNASTVSSTLHIQHWLTDLSAISLYSPRSHASNPAAFGMDVCNVNGAAGEADEAIRTWSDIDSDLEEHIDAGGEGIMPLLKTVILDVLHLGEDQDPSAIGSIAPIYIEKTEKALDRIESHLAWKPELLDDIEEIKNFIVDGVGNECASTFANATAWGNLNSEYAGMFYYALAPAVSITRAIPIPGVISRECIELTADDFFSFYLSIPTAPVLGGCILAFQNGEVKEADDPMFNISYIYPDIQQNVDVLDDSIGGPLCMVSLPGWLQPEDVTDSIATQEDLLTPYEPLSILPRMADAIEHRHEDTDAWQTIAKDLVAFDFLSKVFADRQANGSMPFRADICPGACVHIYIEPVILKEENPVDMYATVQSITLVIDTNGQAYTSITLNNIRNKDEYLSDMYNPDTCPFYEKPWSGVGVPLYEPFEPQKETKYSYS